MWAEKTYSVAGNSKINKHDRHNLGFAKWTTRGGIKSEQVAETTDEIDLRAIIKPSYFYDIYITKLHPFGIDQNQLPYPHFGRDEQLTFLAGKLIEKIILSVILIGLGQYGPLNSVSLF